MKRFRHIFVLCIICVATVSLSAKVENWDTFSEQKAEKRSNQKSAQAASKFSQIVIIRAKEIEGKAINIYVDGEYLSSLLPGAYTQELICAGKHRINLAYTNVANKYKQKRKGGQLINFKAGEKQHVYMLIRKNGKLKFEHYPKNNVSKLLKHYTKKQTHTISRVNKRECTQLSNRTVRK